MLSEIGDCDRVLHFALLQKRFLRWLDDHFLRFTPQTPFALTWTFVDPDNADGKSKAWNPSLAKVAATLLPSRVHTITRCRPSQTHL